MCDYIISETLLSLSLVYVGIISGELFVSMIEFRMHYFLII